MKAIVVSMALLFGAGAATAVATRPQPVPMTMLDLNPSESISIPPGQPCGHFLLSNPPIFVDCNGNRQPQ